MCGAEGQDGGNREGAWSSLFPGSGGRLKSWVQMSEGISAARTSASLFCIFYILFLLFILVPFLFSLVGSSHLPLFCSSQRNSTTHCCRLALFFFLFAYCSAPLCFPHVVRLLSLLEENCSRAPLQRVCLLPPLLYICCSRRRGCHRREEVEEAGVGETRSSSETRVHPGL